MTFAAVQESLERFAHAQTAADIERLCRQFAGELDFESFIYAYRMPTSFPRSSVVLFSGYPERWLDRYWSEELHRVDPVILYCKRHVLPVAWDALASRSPSASRRMMNEAGECGLQAGISMPMHGPSGELGILSFARPGRDRAARAAVQRAQPVVQLLAAHVHEAARRVAGLDPAEPSAPLSARELDCLRWASDGKTSWEIAHILGISERTVNFHIDNAVVKLKAVNRQHALARAIALRAMSPSPF